MNCQYCNGVLTNIGEVRVIPKLGFKAPAVQCKDCGTKYVVEEDSEEEK